MSSYKIHSDAQESTACCANEVARQLFTKRHALFCEESRENSKSGEPKTKTGEVRLIIESGIKTTAGVFKKFGYMGYR